MKSVKASLIYDAVTIALALAVALVFDGLPRAIALCFVLGAVIKAPYDVWEARKHQRSHRDRSDAVSGQGRD